MSYTLLRVFKANTFFEMPMRHLSFERLIKTLSIDIERLNLLRII